MPQPETIGAVIEALHPPPARTAGITLEANPHCRAARFQAYRTAGVNHLSLAYSFSSALSAWGESMMGRTGWALALAKRQTPHRPGPNAWPAGANGGGGQDIELALDAGIPTCPITSSPSNLATTAALQAPAESILSLEDRGQRLLEAGGFKS